jgi:hypothetical protein
MTVLIAKLALGGDVDKTVTTEPSIIVKSDVSGVTGSVSSDVSS